MGIMKVEDKFHFHQVRLLPTLDENAIKLYYKNMSRPNFTMDILLVVSPVPRPGNICTVKPNELDKPTKKMHSHRKID